MDKLPLDDVLVGDALELLKSLPPASIPLIITDPPYGIGYHSNYYKDKNPHAPIANELNFSIRAFLKESARVLAEGGALCLFSPWDVSPLWMGEVAEAGLTLKTKIIWVKDNWSADGVYRAWFSTTNAVTNQNYGYLLINPTTAVFGERD